MSQSCQSATNFPQIWSNNLLKEKKKKTSLPSLSSGSMTKSLTVTKILGFQYFLELLHDLIGTTHLAHENSHKTSHKHFMKENLASMIWKDYHFWIKQNKQTNNPHCLYTWKL